MSSEPIYIKDVLESHRKWVESKGELGERADLQDAFLQQADLHDANLEGANLRGARLSVSDLMRVNLTDADLSGADLWMSDMKDARLDRANLRGANLAEVTNLTPAQVRGALLDDTTILPSDLEIDSPSS